MDKQDVLDDASSFFRCDDEEDLSDIEHDLHPDDGSDEEVHSEATRPHQSACDAPALRAVAPAEETSLRSPGGDDDGDDDDGDDEGSAAYGSVEDATSEWTCRFCTLTSGNTNALLCSICGTIRVERTERTDPPMRGILDEADSIEIRPIRHENDGNDEGWVLFNENRHLCYGWDISTPRGNLCYIRYIGRENEKSFEMEWRHARRKSGRVSAAVSPALLSREQEEEAAAATAKRRQSSCTRKRKAPANGKRGVKSCFGKPTHYLEDRLGKTMDEIDEFMPKVIAGNINECVWYPWKEGKCGPRVYHPVLTLHPSAISGNSEALHKVEVMIREAIEKNDPEMWNKHLIFFYSAKISMRKEGPSLGHKAFALVDPGDLVPYSEGVKRGCNRPENLVSKINSGEMFSGDDEAFWLGLEQIEKDSELDKERRGGPFFFEHERQEYFDQAEKLKKERVREWEKKRVERAGKRAERRREDQRHGFTFSNAAGVELASLELYSGEARMTAALKKNGFGNNFTLDNNPKKKSNSSLSIEQLESMIEENERHRYYHHPIRKCYDVIWAAPCCTTYSIAQSKTIYRTYDCICGIPNKVAYQKAREADDNVDSLIDILLEFRSLNHHHNRKPPIICIENPDGYLPKHPLSARFEDELGLTALKISYCKFANVNNPLPRKDTVLWTNSPSLIDEFKDGQFSCKNDCRCMAKGRHFVGVQNYPDRCAAYPYQMVDFVSKLIAKDARAIASARSK